MLAENESSEMTTSMLHKINKHIFNLSSSFYFDWAIFLVKV